MSFPIEKIDLPPQWRGYYARRQRTLNDPAWAEAVFNVEVQGGVLRTRGGSQIINGWGSYLLPGWIENPSFQAQGQVKDASGFRIGDEVILVYPDGSRWIRNIASITGNTVTLSTTIPGGPPPNQAAIYAVRGMGFGGSGLQIPGLHVAKFRDDALVMLAMGLRPATAYNPALHVVGSGEAEPVWAPNSRAPHVPRTTVLSNWPSAVSGFLANIQGMRIGDRISFPTFGPNTEEREIINLTPGTGAVLLDRPLTTLPSAGQAVTLFPVTITPGQHSAVFSAFGNWLYTVLDGYAPVKYGHIAKTVCLGAPSSPPWTVTSGLVDDGFGFVTDDLALFTYPTGEQYLRRLSSVLGDAFVVSPVLPSVPPAGTIVRNAKVFRVGIRPPTTAPSATFVGAPGSGNAAGERSFRVKFRSSYANDAESEASPPSNRTIPNNQAVSITNIPVSPDPQVTHKDIYSTSAGGDGLWYYAGTITNADTNFTFNISDPALGPLMRDQLDHTPGDNLTSIAPWPQANRLMAIDGGDDLNPRRVVFTDGPDLESGVLRGDAWPADNFLLIGLDSGDDPLAIASFHDSQFVFCERSIWRIRGVPPDLTIETVSYRADNTGIGTFGPRAVVVDQNECFFPGQDGFYLMNRYEGDSTGFQSSRISREIDALWDLTQIVAGNRALLPQLHACFFRQRRQARVWVGLRGGDSPSDCLVYHFDGDLEGSPFGWSYWLLGDNRGDPTLEQGVQASCVGVGSPDIYYIATRTGAVLQMDVNREDTVDPGILDYGGLPYTWQYTVAPLAPAGYGMVARARMLDILWTPHLTVPNLVVAVAVDFGTIPIVSMTVTPPAGSGQLRRERLILLARGQYHQIQLVNSTFNTMIEIQRMAYHVQRLPLPAALETLVQSEPAH